MLIVDGVKYKLWTPRDEEKEFHPMVKAHFKEIFGEDSIYFDVKRTMSAHSGIGSIPDAYVIAFKPRRFYVIENELSTHPLYDHVVNQLTRFINGIEYQNATNQIVDMLYDQINSNNVLRETVQKLGGSPDVYHFLSKLLSDIPTIVIIINEKTDALKEACNSLKYQPTIVEFKTFVKEDDPNIHAHLFEPLSNLGKKIGGKIASGPSTVTTVVQQEYLEFFQELADRLKERVPSAQADPKPRYYCQIPTGFGSVHFEWMFAGKPRSLLGVELHFEKGSKDTNVQLLREMMKYKSEIENNTGEKVTFEENWGHKSSRLYLLKHEGRMTEELKKWAIENMVALYNLLQPKLQALK